MEKFKAKFDIGDKSKLKNACYQIMTQFHLDEPRKIIITLSGKMATGKTTFVKELVGLLNSNSEISSPTFAFHHHYNGKIQIEHWDLYRIKGASDLESVGFWDQFQSNTSLILIEWPERLDIEDLPMDWHVIKLDFYFDPINSERILTLN